MKKEYTLTYCDICGDEVEVINGFPDLGRILTGLFAHKILFANVMLGEPKRIDYCHGCARELAQVITNRMKIAEEKNKRNMMLKRGQV